MLEVHTINPEEKNAPSLSLTLPLLSLRACAFIRIYSQWQLRPSVGSRLGPIYRLNHQHLNNWILNLSNTKAHSHKYKVDIIWSQCMHILLLLKSCSIVLWGRRITKPIIETVSCLSSIGLFYILDCIFERIFEIIDFHIIWLFHSICLFTCLYSPIQYTYSLPYVY